MLQIYNSQTKQKQIFTPIHPGKVSMYVCGQTVYDFCHLGHARKEVAFDVVYRYLIYTGYDVNYVRNITDIDDKIIKRSNENKESFTDLTVRMVHAMHEDFSQLGILTPSAEPKASAHIDGMIKMIETLIEKGFAYPAASGDVYYEVGKFESYGKLSHRNLEDLRAGERVEVAKDKRDSLDFVLWKSAKPDEPSWDSPWGKGRPGWHIECSVMANQCLHQANIDIHGGGMDLMFPHHENEIAQSEAANGESFTNVWMHAGFLQINDEKMSKSLGNFFTIREILKKFQPESLRYFFLTTHYRSPFNYSEQGVREAHSALERLYTALRSLPLGAVNENSVYKKRFIEVMDDDFNMPEALAVLFDLAHEINRLRGENKQAAADLAALLKKLGGILGILQQNPEQVLKAGLSAAQSDLSDEAVDALIKQREQARTDKNWVESDRIRDELKAQGVLLEDQSGKTAWRRC